MDDYLQLEPPQRIGPAYVLGWSPDDDQPIIDPGRGPVRMSRAERLRWDNGENLFTDAQRDAVFEAIRPLKETYIRNNPKYEQTQRSQTGGDDPRGQAAQ